MASDDVEKKSDYTPRTFWGWVTGTCVAIPAQYVYLGAGVVNGVIQYGKDGEFKKGFEKTREHFGETCNKAAKWGDENGDFLTKTAIQSAVAIMTGGVVRNHGTSGS